MAETAIDGLDSSRLTVPALLQRAVERFGEREALVDLSVEPPVRLTYAELAVEARATALALIAAGVAPRDRVAIWAPNMWEWPVTLLGLHLAGAVLVPLNTRYKGHEAAYILRRSGAKVLFTVEGFLGNDYVSMLGEHDLPDLEKVVVLRGETPAGAVGCADFLAATGDAAAVAALEADLDRRIDEMGPDDLSDLLFTSGTTGAPKGVMCTHRQTVLAFDAWGSIVGLESSDRYLIINPFFHSFGYKAGIIASLVKGNTMVPMATFDVGQVMSTIESERITTLPGPPTIFQTIINHPDFDIEKLSTLRLAVTGAASVPVQLIREMRDVLGFEKVLTAYGLTEASGIATVSRHDDTPEVIANYSGRAIPDVEVRIVDEAGNEMPPGEPGEVVIRGYQVMVGYFEAPEQTAEAIDAEGWLHTGDIGVMNEDGYLKITDRTKDMFIVGGFNAYPAEIESLLAEHPAIAQASVVGVPDERMGEVGYAFVVLRPGASATPEEIRTWARANMANYKAPATVEIVDALPLNASGKVLKFELRDRAVAALADGKA
ncbi:MAG: FadD3 family acyl-CoA ligase [Acidimicrobiales bacterium]